LSPNSIIKLLSIWFGILVLAFLNGSFRETVLIPKLGSINGLILSAVLLSLVIFTVAYFSMPWFREQQIETYIIIGISWLCLTVVFEFTFGHFILGKSWIELLGAYSFEGGNLWPIVLVVLAIAPSLTAKIRGLV
jgi:hypothetical protein